MLTRKIDPAVRNKLMEELPQFYGTEYYYQVPLCKGMVYTDGVKFLAETAGAYWLIDAIASWQRECCQNRRLQEMQFWRLEVRDDSSAVLFCCEDSPITLENAKVFQQIEYKDFPLDSIDLYVCLGEQMTIMLPGEY